MKIFASRKLETGMGGPGDCCFLLKALFCLILLSLNFKSNQGHCGHPSAQPTAALWPAVPCQTAHPLQENGSSSGPFTEELGVAASPLPPEAQSSGFPVYPKAVCSTMRYRAGLRISLSFSVQQRLVQLMVTRGVKLWVSSLWCPSSLAHLFPYPPSFLPSFPILD